MSKEKNKVEEDRQATHKQAEADRKNKIQALYEKAVKANGEALDKLSKN